MSIFPALLFGALGFAGPRTDDVRYVDASLDLADELLDHLFVDVDGDGRPELCLAMRRADGGRELRLHHLEGERLAATPAYTIPVMEDVLAYGFADVRAEAGREIVFLTKTGAWSCSPTKPGLRGNIRRLVEAELLYDVPDPRALPAWRYFLDGADGESILLPGPDGFAVYGPAPGDPPTDPELPAFRRRGEFDDAFREERAELDGATAETQVSFGSGGMAVHTTLDMDVAFLLGDEGGRSSNLASDQLSYRAPALADLDGDGDRDLVRWAEDGLHIHLHGPDGIRPTPDRVEALPAYLQEHEDELSLRLVDFDGDGRRDLLGQIDKNAEDFENSEITLLILVNDGKRMLPALPGQILRFAAAMVNAELVDVNADGRPDLVVREFELPGLVDTVTGLEFRLTHLVYPAASRGARMFERKPLLKQSQVFDEESVGAAIANRHLALDCDGDGIPDLVEVDLHGRIAIRRLVHESSFFGGDRWKLEVDPWKRFDAQGSIDSLAVRDLNGDGLGDIVSRGRRSLTVFLSARRGGGGGR